MKAQEIEGEFNEQEEEEDDTLPQEQKSPTKSIDCDMLKTYADFKKILMGLEEERILKLCQLSEDSIIQQTSIMDDIETLKKKKQNDQIQHISKVFSMVPQYVQKLHQIQQLQSQTRSLLEKIKKKSRID